MPSITYHAHSIHSQALSLATDWLLIDHLLAEQGGVCAVINKTRSTYINTTGQVEEDIKRIYDHTKRLHCFTRRNPTADFVWQSEEYFAFHNLVSAPAETLDLYPTTTTVQTMSF